MEWGKPLSGGFFVSAGLLDCFFTSTLRDLAKIEFKNDMSQLCFVMGSGILSASELL